MKQPKFSEVLRAAARGHLAPYGGGQQSNQFFQAQSMGQMGQMGPIFDSRDYALAKGIAGAFDALASVYEMYEANESKDG